MSLHSISVMVVTPLVLVVGAVLVLTPRDILRQPVLPTTEVQSEPIPIYTSSIAPVVEIPVVQFETPVIQPASLIVVASAAQPPSGREIVAAPALSSMDRRWITARGLNVRTGPTVQAELVGSLPYGTPVNVLETSGTWAHVETGELTGWLSANFLTDQDPSAN